jgi:hypothetical protein
MTETLRACLVSSVGGRLFAAYWGSLALVDLTRSSEPLALMAVALLVAALARHQPPAVALGVAAIGWSFLTGFVSHAAGDLRGTGPADLVRFGALVAAALLVAACTRPQRASR